MDPRFSQALIQAATTRANTGPSPAATPELGGQIANLGNLANLQFLAAGSSASGKALAGEAGSTADREEAARRAAAEEAQMRLQQSMKVDERIAATKDPKNYQRVLNDAGGYTYYDGAGKAISVNEYSRATNQTIAKALDGSADPTDVDFVNDYKDTMQLGQIMATGNKKELDKFYEARPGLKDFVNQSGIKTWSEFVQSFRSAYPDRFGQAQADTTSGRPVSSLSIRG